MDGVSLGLRKAFMPWKKYFLKKNNTEIYDGSSHNMRVFVNNQATRKLITRFVNEGLDIVEFRTLQHNIALYQPSLVDIFRHFEDEGFYKAPEVYKETLLMLASNYPVCGFVHFQHRLFHILSNWSDVTTSDMLLIEKEIPVVATLLKKLEWNLPAFLKPVFTAIAEKAQAPFLGQIHKLPTCDFDCECRGKGYLPSLPTMCHRGNYILDDKRPKMESTCTKKTSTHPSLIPGLFTVSCIHGICYGYDIMEDAENPNIPFTILRTRFHTAPKLIIYDNACNLHQYCLNRDPVFFRDSWFVVDRFHWINHVGCHAGYNLDNYMQSAWVNTQVAEQRNATLKRLKSMLSYMNLDNFKNHVNLFIWFRSMLSLAVLKPDLPLKDFQLFIDLSKIYSTLK